ncbi:MAG: polysaccharide deacetylase family protein [Verrucomicrobiaceae bacterium]|nr:polysaccharide deacetylase family protein [Verrucomicrobiaceae bacterium]
MKRCIQLLATLAFASGIIGPGRTFGEDLGGVKVALSADQGPAVVQAQLLDKFKVKVHVDAHGETRPLAVRVDLPNSGPNIWPAADVEVRDAGGKAMVVQRTGIEWFKLSVPLPTGVTDFVVQAVKPAGGWSKPTSEKLRAIQDGVSGVQMRIAKWHGGRAAALSIRFDDSHPTHLTKAVPILREYGFRGTFMICPGASESGGRRTSEFDQHRAEWEALAARGDQEFANHSAHHRGGFGDEDMEAEIGEAAEAIWKLVPDRSKLTALNLGGGTRWDTTRTLRYYLDKYHHFDASENSTGMDDSYGNRVENFRRILEQHLQRGLWCRIHYHYIGDGLSSTEANFRAALDIAKEHSAKLWIAGMADIFKYQRERDAATLELVESDAEKLVFRVRCTTDPTLYDQSLTVEIVLPPEWKPDDTVVKDQQGTVISTKATTVDGKAALRFEVPPIEAVYSLRSAP